VRANDTVDFASSAGYPRELIYSDLACLLIAQDRAAEALPLLAPLAAANSGEGMAMNPLSALIAWRRMPWGYAKPPWTFVRH
jgi:hypothetical protein